MSREELLAYYCDERTDLPPTLREQIRAKITSASDQSIETDQSCPGKHWFYMNAADGKTDARSTCPYCGWVLTLSSSRATV